MQCAEMEIDTQFSLFDLPNELIFKIFSYLDSTSLEIVWKFDDDKLCNILNSSSYWNMHLRCQITRNIFEDPLQKNIPEVNPSGEEISEAEGNWFTYCLPRIQNSELWGSQNPENILQRKKVAHGAGSVDSLHFLPFGDENLLAAGSRDRCLAIYRPSDFTTSSESLTSSSLCSDSDCLHAGWIWSIRGNEHSPQLLTACWDCQLNLIDYGESSLRSISKYKCGSPALCTRWLTPNTSVVACYGKSVRVVDWRVADDSRGCILPSTHRGAVFSLAVLNDTYFLSGSEDRSLVVWDIRNNKAATRLQLLPPMNGNVDDSQQIVSLNSQYALSLSSSKDVIWAGDRSGGVHLLSWNQSALQLTHEDTFTNLGHSRPITGLYTDDSILMAASEGGVLSMSHVHRKPTPLLSTADSSVVSLPDRDTNMKILSLAYKQNCLALGDANGTVSMWSKRQSDSDS